MATNGMTINGLNPLSALTADDKIPVWDTGASGEPTKEITAQNMANSVKSLASLPNTTEMNTAIEQSTADVIRTGDVVNSLTSTSTTAPLSANMGKELNDTIKSTGVPITKGAKIGSFMAQCCVQSNVVLMSGYMDISATLQTNDVIATLTGISADANNIRIPFFLNNGSGKMFFGKIAQNGNQILADSALNNTASGQYYVFNFSFPATIGSAS